VTASPLLTSFICRRTRSFRSVVRSLSLLERALALDPYYAPALADAAFCLQVLDINCGDLNRQEIRRKALALARKALGSSDDPGSMSCAAFVLAYFGDDIDEVRSLLDHALSLNPSFARGWYMSGMARLYAGEPEEAIEALETSLRLSPKDRLTRRNHAGLGIAHLFMGHVDEAVPGLRLMVQEFPRWATPYAALASCYEAAGSHRDAVAVAARLKAVDRSLIPTAVQFRNPKHRALLAPGVRLGGNLTAA
jgi:tetratricopeptide (TPR) repeat protein